MQGGRNLPATPSLAVNLRDLVTETAVLPAPDGQDTVLVDGVPADPVRFHAFFDNLRSVIDKRVFFRAESRNNFPASAGLARSSSGFAALAAAAVRAAGCEVPLAELSALARVGSASAARAVFGGFVLLPAGASAASQVHDAAFWPELRVIVVKVDAGQKAVSSRVAMERVRETSPYYQSWVDSASKTLSVALSALERRDLEALGQAAHASYLAMFATMMGADPPILYWKPASLAVIHACARLRAEGIGAWETMDAGPQVKILCEVKDVVAITARLAAEVPELGGSAALTTTGPGPGLVYVDE
jgi:diphosphomevalonate decarboxylase